MQERGSDDKFYIQLQQYKKKKKNQSSKPDSIFIHVDTYCTFIGIQVTLVFPLDKIILYSPQAQPPRLPSAQLVSLYVSNIVPCLNVLGFVHSPHIE